MNDFSSRNRDIFGSLPNTFYEGEVPSLGRSAAPTPSFWRRWYIPLAAAAVLIPLAVIGVLSLGRGSAPTSPGSLVTYSVDKGVKGLVALEDGTKVNLNSGSTLSVLGSRHVFLDGEGWFEVESNPSDPFLVDTPSGITVRVTGTMFNLSNYKDEDFKVLLVKGNIELDGTAPGIPTEVVPSQQVTVKNGKAGLKVTGDREQKNATAWKEGVLVFEDKPLYEAIPMIERWYGVHFNVTSPEILKERLTGEFETETIQEVMSVLSLTHRFFYNINGKDVTIVSRK